MAVPPYQLRQKPIDTWSIREKLALASSVERTRDQNWVSVSRQIKPFAETNRPQDWFSQKNCALQYGALLEDVEHPKRKRGEEIATPGSIIVKNLVQERIQELEQLLKDGREKHEKLQKELAQLKDARTDDQAIEAMVDEANKAVENEMRQEQEYEQWLKERELEAERQRQLRLQMLAMKTKKQVRTISDASDSIHSDDSNLIAAPESPLPPPPSSLLTTLLRSPSQSPNQSPRTSHGSLQLSAAQSVSVQRLSTESQHSGAATPVLTPTVPSSVQAPTLSKLLEQPLSTPTSTSAGTASAVDDKSQVKLQFETVKQEVVTDDKLKREPTFQETLSAIEDVTSRLQESHHIPPLDPSIAGAVDAVPEDDVGDENIISVIEQLQEDMQRKEEEEQHRKQLMALQQTQEVGSENVADSSMKPAPQSELQHAPLIDDAVTFKSLEPPAAAAAKGSSLELPSPEPSPNFDVKTQQTSSQQQQQQQQSFEIAPAKEQSVPQTQSAQAHQQEQDHQPLQTGQNQDQQRTVQPALERQQQQEQPHPPPQQKDPPLPQEPQQQHQLHLKEELTPSDGTKTEQAQPDQARPEQQSKSQAPTQQQTTSVTKQGTPKVNVASEKSTEKKPKEAQLIKERDHKQRLSVEQSSAVMSPKSSSAQKTSKVPTATTEEFQLSTIKSQVPKASKISSVPGASEEMNTEKKEETSAVKVETLERTETTKCSSSAFVTEEASGQDCQEAPIYEEHVTGHPDVESDPFTQNAKDGLPEQDEMIEEEVSEEEIAQDQDQELDIKNTAGLESQTAVPAVKTPKEPTPDKERDVDRERDQKIWKKSALLVWRTAANHSNANVFMSPVPEDMAPGYDDIVFKPMDLTTIRRNIESGAIKTTMELLRDMMLMFQNAIMYNSADHDVYHMAIEMQDDVVKQIEELMANETSERSGGAHPPEGVKRPARLRHSDSDMSSKKPRRSTGFGFK